MSERAQQIMGFVLTVVLAPLAVAGSCCLGVGTGLHYCGTQVLALRRRGLRASFHPGAIAWSALWHVVAFPLLTAAFSSAGENSLLLLAAGTGAALLHAMVLAPLSFLIPAQLHQRTVLLETAHVLWDQVRLTERLLLVLLRTIPTAAAIGVFLMVNPWLGTHEIRAFAAFAVAGIVYGVGSFVYSDYLARVYARVNANREPRTTPKRDLWSSMFALAMSLACVGYMSVSLMRASPMQRSTVPSLMEMSGGEEEGTQQALALGLRLEARGDVHLGGEGRDVHFYGAHESPMQRDSYGFFHREPSIVVAEAAGADRFLVHVRHVDRWRQFSVDGQGNRTDGSWIRQARGEVNGFAVFVLCMVALLLGLGWRRERELRRRKLALMRYQDVDTLLANTSPNALSPGFEGEVRVAIRGVLQGKCQGIAERLIGDLVIEAMVNGTKVRLRVPPEGVKTALVGAPTADQTFEDGKIVTLLGELKTLAQGQREAFLSWPTSAVLVAGTRDAFVTRIMIESRGRTRTWLFFAGVLSLTALVLAAFH